MIRPTGRWGESTPAIRQRLFGQEAAASRLRGHQTAVEFRRPVSQPEGGEPRPVSAKGGRIQHVAARQDIPALQLGHNGGMLERPQFRDRRPPASPPP